MRSSTCAPLRDTNSLCSLPACSLGVYAHFQGDNYAGRGRGVATVSVSSTFDAPTITAAFSRTARLPFVDFKACSPASCSPLLTAGTHQNPLCQSSQGASMDRGNWSAATGASRWPLSYGLAVVNLVAPDFDRFHLLSDAEGSVNVSALDALTTSVAEALEAYMCHDSCVQH